MRDTIPATRIGVKAAAPVAGTALEASTTPGRSPLAVLLAATLAAGCTLCGAPDERAGSADASAIAAPATYGYDTCPMASSGYAPVNGLEIYYEVHGAAGGETTPLVLLHGGGSTIQTSFGRVLPSLAKSRRVIAFEQQGHGHTADVDRPYSFEQSADDTATLLRHLDVERADLFGFSNGGSIALQAAIRHPGLVRRLVVGSAMFKRDGLYPEVWASMERATLQDMPEELQEAYRRVSPHPDRLREFHDKCVTRMLEFADWQPESIQSIQAPTLVMLGDSDIVRLEHAVEMFRLLPHARLAVLPDSDHMKFVERADWQVSMIEAFLEAPMPSRELRK